MSHIFSQDYVFLILNTHSQRCLILKTISFQWDEFILKIRRYLKVVNALSQKVLAFQDDIFSLFVGRINKH